MLENQPALAKALLELREGGAVRLKEDDLDKAAPIEELARRALRKWKARDDAAASSV